VSARSIGGNNAVPDRRLEEQSPNGWLLPHLKFGAVAGAGIVLVWCSIIFARDALSADQGWMLMKVSTISILVGSLIRTLRRSNGFAQRFLALLGVAFAMWIGWSIAAVLALVLFAPDTFHALFGFD
jgi:hypothetical protein